MTNVRKLLRTSWFAVLCLVTISLWLCVAGLACKGNQTDPADDMTEQEKQAMGDQIKSEMQGKFGDATEMGKRGAGAGKGGARKGIGRPGT